MRSCTRRFSVPRGFSCRGGTASHKFPTDKLMSRPQQVKERVSLCYNSDMTTISISDLRNDPIGCVRRAQAGETLLVTDQDVAIAEIKPTGVSAECPGAQPRPFGLAIGEFTVPEDFDVPLPDEIIDDFGRV